MILTPARRGRGGRRLGALHARRPARRRRPADGLLARARARTTIALGQPANLAPGFPTREELRGPLRRALRPRPLRARLLRRPRLLEAGDHPRGRLRPLRRRRLRQGRRRASKRSRAWSSAWPRRPSGGERGGGAVGGAFVRLAGVIWRSPRRLLPPSGTAKAANSTGTRSAIPFAHRHQRLRPSSIQHKFLSRDWADSVQEGSSPHSSRRLADDLCDFGAILLAELTGAVAQLRSGFRGGWRAVDFGRLFGLRGSLGPPLLWLSVAVVGSLRLIRERPRGSLGSLRIATRLGGY